MNKNLKKILITGASLLMMVGVGASVNSLTTTDNTVHAESILQAYRRSEPQDAKWHNVRGAYQNQANFGFNKKIGGTITANFKTGKPVTVHRHRHTITVVPMLDDPGKIIKIDGHRVYSRHQVLSMMHVRKHIKHHVRSNYYPRHMYRYLAYNHDSFGGADNMTGRVHYAKVQIIKIHNLVRHTHNPNDQVYTCRTDNRGFKKTFKKVNQGFHIRYQRIHGHVYVLDNENGGTLVK